MRAFAFCEMMCAKIHARAYVRAPARTCVRALILGSVEWQWRVHRGNCNLCRQRHSSSRGWAGLNPTAFTALTCNMNGWPLSK